MSGINFAAFNKEGTRNRAAGIGGGGGLPNGGIIDPQPYTVPKGTRLVRFGGFPKIYQRETGSLVDGGSQYFAPQVASGEWWLDWEGYSAIEKYADQKRESVTYTLRQTCAVPAEWSDMSFVIQAVSRSNLLAYTGYGRAANIRNKKGKLVDRINPSTGDKPLVRQLFIPGLNAPDLRKQAVFVHGTGFLDPKMSKIGERAKAEQKAAMDARLRAAVKAR